MTSKALAQVLIRILGVYFIVASFASVSAVLMFIGPSQFRSAFVGAVLNVIVTFVAGIVLIRNGDQIGAWLTSDFEPAETSTSGVDLLPVALTILGVWFLIVGLRSACIVGVELLARAKWEDTPAMQYVWQRERQVIVVATVDTIAGIILISGRQGLVNAWARLRGRD